MLRLLKQIGVLMVPSFILIVFFIVFYYRPENERAKEKIKEITQENKTLKRKNEEIMQKINQYEVDLAKSDEVIAELYDKQYMLTREISGLQNKITDLKNKYNEADTHATNYTSNEIAKYFADLK